MTSTGSGAGPSSQQQQQLALSQQQAASLGLQSAPKLNALGYSGLAGASSAAAAIAATGNGRGGRAKQLQQRAAAAAQALNTERKMSTREIQAMLEKNETALRGWNALHKQQPPKALTKEHKEWTRRCLTYRQQIGARLEVLASLADKQIAQEDEKNGGKQRAPPTATSASTDSHGASSSVTVGGPQSRASAAGVPPPPMTSHPTQVSTMGNPTTSGAVSEPIGGATTSSTITMPTITAESPPPTVFPEPPMPMAGMPSASTAMFFPTGQSGAMQMASGSMAVSGVNSSTQGFPMASQSFAPNTYMTSTSMPTSSSADFMTPQNYNLMGSMGMMAPQQQFIMMPMQMPMNLAASTAGSGAMYNLNANMYGNMQLPADPFNTGFGVPAFQTQQAFNNAAGFPMNNGMAAMQTPQMMGGPMNAGGFGALPDPSMMMNNFPFGAPGNGMNVAPPPSSQGMMPSQQPAGSAQAYQAAPAAGPQAFQQQGQQQPQQDTSATLDSFADPALFDDTASSANLFDGFPDDAFLPMQ